MIDTASRTEDEAIQLSLAEIDGSVDETCKCDLQKIRYQAQVDAYGHRLDAEVDESKALRDADLGSLKSFYDSILAVGTASIERSRQAAEAVRTAAAAVGGIYTAVLALAFSADRPLPPRGLLAAGFLGLAIVLATAFVAWLPRTVEQSTVNWPDDSGFTREDLKGRVEMYLAWVREGNMRRRSYLRAAVLALGFGIAFLPIAFVGIGSATAHASAAAQTPFPNPPALAKDASAGTVDLAKIKYQAQVDEAAEVRKGQIQATLGESPSVLGFWLVYGAALAAAGLVALVARTRSA